MLENILTVHHHSLLRHSQECRIRSKQALTKFTELDLKLDARQKHTLPMLIPLLGKSTHMHPQPYIAGNFYPIIQLKFFFLFMMS